jgi:hypothetical protein
MGSIRAITGSTEGDVPRAAPETLFGLLPAQVVGGRAVTAESSVRGMPRSYVEGIVICVTAHRDLLVALLQILTAGGFLPSVQAEAAAAVHVQTDSG